MFDMFDAFEAPVVEYLVVLIALAVWVPVLLMLGWFGIIEIWDKWRK